jgi:hypothetical protein
MANSVLSGTRILRNWVRIPVIPGAVFGRLTVVEESPKRQGERAVLVRCFCGIEKVVRFSNLRSGNSLTCGCKQHPPKHGHYGSPTYRSWLHLIQRCTSSNPKCIKDYSARGISFDPAWKRFENFLADMGERPAGKTIERIDNDGPYTKANCRWATVAEQMRNTRRNRFVLINEKQLCLAEAARTIGADSGTIRQRAIRHGITLQEAFDHYASRGAPGASASALSTVNHAP